MRIAAGIPGDGGGPARDVHRAGSSAVSALAVRISIGILAHNEGARIERTIGTLLRQTLIRQPGGAVGAMEVVCVPNGCTDDTAGRARAAMASRSADLGGERLSMAVRELASAGKCNAWNRFVHELSDPGADLLFLVDGDIWFDDERCMEKMVAALLASPGAHACVDRPLKDVARTGGGSVVDRASVSLSEVTQSGPPVIAGSLYCARAAVLRRIWLPEELLVDDGFVRAMILTDCFTSPERIERLVRAPGATHLFEAYRGLRAIFRHSKRLAVGTAVNCILFDHLGRSVTDGSAGDYFKRMTEGNPGWVREFIGREVRSRGWWVVGHGEAWRRLGNLRSLALGRRLVKLPLVLAGTVFDLVVLAAANRDLKVGRIRW